MKPHINIGTIGHIGYGKTTLTAAITASLVGTQGQVPPTPYAPLEGLYTPTVIPEFEYTMEPAPPAQLGTHHDGRCRSTVRRGLWLPLSRTVRGGHPQRPEPGEDDLECIAAAQRKRDRKAQRNTNPTNHV